jgi:acetyl esterase
MDFGMLQSLRVNDTQGLDPKAKRIIAALSSNSSFKEVPAGIARDAYRNARKPYLWPLDDVASIEDLDTRGAAPPMLLFRPIENRSRGLPATYLFLHGGGWTVGDIATYEPLCRRLSNLLYANIIWVDYRLAPEHPFPAPLDDTLAASRWIFANAFRFGINPGRVGIMGDSAGANLAAAAALFNIDGNLGEKFIAQILIYPCLDLTRQHPSHAEFAEGFLLTRELYAWYVKNYLGRREARDAHVSPLFATDVTGLAPAVILHAGFDPLRDEAIAYAAKLRRAKVPVKEIAFADMIHGFINMGAALPQAEDAILCIRSALHTLLANRISQK